MQHQHKTPCAECPWRKVSPAGWLGGHPAEYYADAVAAGEVPACHLKDHGPESDDTAFCAGALACMTNQAMLPMGQHPGQETATEARQDTPPNPEVFFHHSQFFEHHTGTKWVPPYLRTP